MTVNLSALAGAGAQFLDNSGNILSGGKLYSYAAGTTTPQITYTSASGSTPHANPIILNSAGRVATGEIWLTAGSNYKFVLYTSTDVLIATWDNITGINGTGITTNASSVEYDPAGTGAVATTVQAKLRETVSVTDFGAVGDGVVDDTAAIQAGIDYLESLNGGVLYFPQGTYRTTSTLTSNNHGVMLKGEGEGNYFGTLSAVTLTTPATTIKYEGFGTAAIHFTCTAGTYKKVGGGVEAIFINCGSGTGSATYGILVTSRDKLTVRNVLIFNATAAAVRTECFPGLLASAVSGYDVQNCLFENVSSAAETVNITTKGLQLTGGQGNGGVGQGNTSFNTFINTRWFSAPTEPAVEIGNTDNNTFVALRANGGGSESPITVGAIEFLSREQTGTGAARFNNIYGCEAVGGVIARAATDGTTSSFNNNIYGYNISNGGQAPVIQSGSGGSDNASLTCFYYDRAYMPFDLAMPLDGVLNFDNTSASLPDARTVAYSRLGLYEHGNLASGTVTIQGTTSAGTATYGVAAGSYTRVGRMVFVQMTITWTAHTGTGDIRITGLPFTVVIASNRLNMLNVIASNLAYTAGNYLAAGTESNTKSMLLYQVSAAAAVSGVPIDAAATLYISGTYQAE